jgi:hypothetical protein
MASEEEGTVVSAKAEVAAAFERFWAVYPPRFGKRVGRVGAQKLFARAVKDGVDPEVIIAGASAYARRRAGEIADGDEERWTKEPTNWLKEGKWDEAASGDGGRLLDQHGGDIVTPQHGGNGHDEDPSTSWDDPHCLEKAVAKVLS